MSGPGLARPDLCSIRTADDQEEPAEAVRGGFSADGYPPGADDQPAALTSGIDRAIRLSTAVAVLAVAGIAAYVSYGPPTPSAGHTARPGSPPGSSPLRSTAWSTPVRWWCCTRPGTGCRYPASPGGCWRANSERWPAGRAQGSGLSKELSKVTFCGGGCSRRLIHLGSVKLPTIQMVSAMNAATPIATASQRKRVAC